MAGPNLSFLFKNLFFSFEKSGKTPLTRCTYLNGKSYPIASVVEEPLQHTKEAWVLKNSCNKGAGAMSQQPASTWTKASKRCSPFPSRRPPVHCSGRLFQCFIAVSQLGAHGRVRWEEEGASLAPKVVAENQQWLWWAKQPLTLQMARALAKNGDV